MSRQVERTAKSSESDGRDDAPRKETSAAPRGKRYQRDRRGNVDRRKESAEKDDFAGSSDHVSDGLPKEKGAHDQNDSREDDIREKKSSARHESQPEERRSQRKSDQDRPAKGSQDRYNDDRHYDRRDDRRPKYDDRRDDRQDDRQIKSGNDRGHRDSDRRNSHDPNDSYDRSKGNKESKVYKDSSDFKGSRDYKDSRSYRSSRDYKEKDSADSPRYSSSKYSNASKESHDNKESRDIHRDERNSNKTSRRDESERYSRDSAERSQVRSDQKSSASRQSAEDKGRTTERSKRYSVVKSERLERSQRLDSTSESENAGAEILSLIQKKPQTPKSKTKESNPGKVASAADLETQWIKEEEDKRKKDIIRKKKEEHDEERRRKEESRKRKEEKIREEKERRLKEIEDKKIKEEEEKEAEELKKVQEEDRIKLEEEERVLKEKDDADRQKEEELKSINDFVSEVNERNTIKFTLRAANLKALDARPDERFFTKLDSSLKKNTAFVRKMKNLTELQKESLSKDFEVLNLTKYIGEVACSVTEAKIKMSDIPTCIHMCSLLHQRYAEFSPTLLEGWNKVLPSKKDEKVNNASKLRVDLRLFAELVSVGVFNDKAGLGVLANQLLFLTSQDHEEHNNLAILLSFARHCGDDYAGLLPRKYRLLGEKYGIVVPQKSFLPAGRQKACHHLLKEYFTSLCKHLLKLHDRLSSLEKQNRKVLHTRGELSDERRQEYTNEQEAFKKLLANATVFADIVDGNLPDLPVHEFKDDLDILDFDPNDSSRYEEGIALFEDEDTRAFYENLPDLRALIPSILYSESENVKASVEEDQELIETEMSEVAVEDIEEEIAASQEVSQAEVEAEESSEPPCAQLEVEEDDIDINSSLRLILESFINTLANCVNRELIDKAAMDFCTNLNTKPNRKKLVRALFTVHRTRYDLLPFYSRFVAILHPCMPAIATDLGASLKGDFRWHVRKKDQINIESKLKTVRFMGELVKFKMFPKAEALYCLKMLLFDFSHHNIEMACAFLDTCGRFLYHSAESHHRTKVYLELMMRKKNALHLDTRYATLIENAYYYSNPPESNIESKPTRPPLHQYIRRLLYKDLSKVSTERVLRQLRKLDWEDEELVSYVIKCLTSAHNIRYNSIHCAANLLAGVAPYHEHTAVHVVDGVLEDIRAGMEINHPKYNQRRVSSVKYLGELYNYRMLESAVIFRTLYSLITFGVSLDESIASPLDPAEHLFRIRLVCVILETCGIYFDRGSSKKKLDCFLVYFQRYYWFKRSLSVWSDECPFPIEVEYLMKDTVEALRPKLILHDNYEQASESADKLDSDFREKLSKVLPKMNIEEEFVEGDDSLHPIKEIDEEMSQGLSQSQGQSQGLSQVPGSDHDVSTLEEDSDNETGSQSQPRRGGDRERRRRGTQEDGEEETVESAGEDEQEDQVTLITGGLKFEASKEDDDFMAAFDAVMVDSINTRHNEQVKQVDIALPMHLRGQKKEYHSPVLQLDPTDASQDIENIPTKDTSIKFTLLTKQGNKQKFATLNVPISAEFANKFQERLEKEKTEKDKMKQVVLDIHERQEEEDYQEMLAGLARLGTVSATQPREPRSNKQKYQHPKGAPDADAIFS